MKLQYAAQFLLTPMRSVVRETRASVEGMLTDTYASAAAAAGIAVSELVENAIKYGTGSVDVRCEVVEELLRIVVSNGISNQTDLDEVKRHIDRINAAPDPLQLYSQRLTELMEDAPSNSSQLGLYRIAYESACRLAYTIHEGQLEIEAIRDLSAAESDETDG